MLSMLIWSAPRGFEEWEMEKKEGLLGWGGRSGKKRKKRKKERKGKGERGVRE